MNESLAKQLHDLCGDYKEILKDDVDVKIDFMEQELHKIIENHQKEKNQNNIK